MRKITLLFAFLASMSMLMSCDEHEPVDLDVHTGYVLCDDGQVLSTDVYFRQDMKKAVAVVFAPQTEEHGVLAVLLDEIMDWAVEIPAYQRQNIVIASSERVNIDTVTPDVTTYWGWLSDLETMQMNETK